MDQLSPEFVAELKQNITGEVKVDPISRVLFSTDASIHKIQPLGVVFPRSSDELVPIVRMCHQYGIPIIPRGSGSGLAGGCIGKGLIVDCSRYLNRLVSLNLEERSAVVEPGLVLDDFNRAVRKYDLVFGPDPASSERATLGGCIGNNAAGAHSIEHGMTADHILAVDVVLADGAVAAFRQVPLDEINRSLQTPKNYPEPEIITCIYRSVQQIRRDYADDIRKAWPGTWRRVSGYNLNYLLPWSPTYPPQWDTSTYPYPPVAPGTINLAQIMAGSEGTLALIRNATLRLVPVKQHTVLSVINFSSISEACDSVVDILELSPSAVELIPQSLIHLARSVPAYASLLSFVVGDPAAMLVVEFSGNELKGIKDKISRLNQLQHWPDEAYLAETPKQQKQVWDVRKVGLGILMSRLGAQKPISFIEDMSVPVERLSEFVSRMVQILAGFHTEADFYGHASAGCLHIRPLINIKTPQGRQELRQIAEATADLVISLGGAVSAEHGDGITRGEWIERAYGPKVVEACRLLKLAADPTGILNPGKIVNPPRMDSSLRYDDAYQPVGWASVMAFSSSKAEPKQLVAAIEQCNGAGVCRKSTGVMCPSFQATKDEMFSTRGRANLLREMISNGFTSQESSFQAVKQSLELCLACKGCKAECPSAVDMAKLKYEFYQYYYSLPGHRHPLRDYLFGYISTIARYGHHLAPILNIFLSAPAFAGLRRSMLGLSKERSLPELSRMSFRARARSIMESMDHPDCLFLSDAFNEYFYPETGMDALQVLKSAGVSVKVLRNLGAGRTLVSKGFLTQAKEHAHNLIDEIRNEDPDGKLPVVGLEPSEIYTLKDEFLDFFPGDETVAALSRRAYLVDEFLLRPGRDNQTLISRIRVKQDIASSTNVLLHGHCYQKAQPPAVDGYPVGVAASAAILEYAGYVVKVIDDGCCGMAGAFGYEAEHYDTSLQVGRLALFPAIDATDDPLVAAAGISCQSQILDGTGVQAHHPISLLARRCEWGS
ncbi:MAG: FAD-binding oxidoreductase [Anaerolineales bacterium]|nr:FAD-binding protein [Anaerolineae bacterium]PWB52979.1 MAG: FAD-binding oxidoreductase [Anaerolineales bacterium]